jgi:hypothetical protein
VRLEAARFIHYPTEPRGFACEPTHKHRRPAKPATGMPVAERQAEIAAMAGISDAKTICAKGAPPISNAPLLVNRSGAAYSKDTLGDDFRDIQRAEFGAEEKRQLQDMRRSGTIEAVAGEVEAGTLAKKLGNTIDQSRELQMTYAPAHEAVVRLADKARVTGRRRIPDGK